MKSLCWFSIDNDRLKSSLFLKISRLECKTHAHLWLKRLKNHTLCRRTYLYSPYKRVPPPPDVTISSSKIFKHSCNLSPLQTTRRFNTLLLFANESSQTLRLSLKSVYIDATYKMENPRWHVLEWRNCHVVLLTYSHGFTIIAWAVNKVKKKPGLKRITPYGFTMGRASPPKIQTLQTI